MRAPRLLRRAPCAVAILLAAVALAPAPAGAQDSEPVLTEVDHGIAAIAAELVDIGVDGPAAAAAQRGYDDTVDSLAATIAARTGAEAELVALANREVELTTLLGVETANRKAAGLALAGARHAFAQAASTAYVTTSTYDDLSRIVDLEASVEVGTVQTYSEASRDELEVAQQLAAAEVHRTSLALDVAQLDRLAGRQRTVEVTAARDQSAAEEARLTEEVAVRAIERDRARATSQVTGTDFTLVALDAYWRAAGTQVDCGVAWWALAGISRVEGRHGTFGGAELLADGNLSRPIIGIPLTGEAGTALIPDSDAGALDGDPAYDRAVGPMQFIPSTWARWGRDGDGDGDGDPQNIYDATAAAAAYLCHGRRLDTEDGIRAGYFSYNHSLAYVENVLSHAYRYAALAVPPVDAVTAGP